jgi:hypothetical protein
MMDLWNIINKIKLKKRETRRFSEKQVIFNSSAFFYMSLYGTMAAPIPC